jgi:UDP-N-acetylenolpyruvoylglucosamine reductase
LILINKGGGSGQNVADFASILQKCVWDRYGVVLEPEVMYVG